MCVIYYAGIVGARLSGRYLGPATVETLQTTILAAASTQSMSSDELVLRGKLPARTPPLCNPYLEVWLTHRQHHVERLAQITRALLSRDPELIETLKANRTLHTHQFAYAIPTHKALSTIGRYGPIVEIGAGTGYWAWMLRQATIDVVAYDLHPPCAASDQNRFHMHCRCWTDVLAGDESALDHHPQRTLFLCWPPAGDPMAFRALNRYVGQNFNLRRRRAAAKRCRWLHR